MNNWRKIYIYINIYELRMKDLIDQGPSRLCTQLKQLRREVTPLRLVYDNREENVQNVQAE